MGMFARFFPRQDDSAEFANRAELVARYRQIRGVASRLGNELLEGVSKSGFHAAGRRLGILRGEALILRAKEDLAVMTDYCLYEIRENGRTAVEKYLIQSQLDPESNEMLVLRAMQHAVYSLFEIESLAPGFGVRVRDLLSDESTFAIDLGMSSSGEVGYVFAGRLLTMTEFSMFSGASIPLDWGIPGDSLDELIACASGILEPDEEGVRDSGLLIRASLQWGLMESVRYQDVTGSLDEPDEEEWDDDGVLYAAPRRNLKPPLPVRTGPNGPCPCGSGRKRKNCCKSRA